jgi:Ca-activated chloride channel family protein
MRLRLALALCLAAAAPAKACDTALLLAIDISGSIDAGEYRLQVDGLADALSDPEVAEALLQGQVALSVVQWSGTGWQALVLPWRRMLTPGDIAAFGAEARSLRRRFDASDTAVGQAITFSLGQFPAVADCPRHVIDISGDGPENAGFTVARARTAAEAQGVEINAIAIEDRGISTPITAFYRRWAITKGGFVITARGLDDYPRAIREKLLRELTKPAA